MALMESGFVSQKTLKASISCTGTGLHCGDRITMVLHPSEPDSGIVFRRTDLPGSLPVPAHWRNVVATQMCTTIGNGTGVRISTVEHLMAAFAGCGLDNAVIEIDGPEVPIMDGSAAPFVFLIECAGIEEQNVPRQAIQIRKPVEVRDGDRVARLVPYAGFSVCFEIDFTSPVISRQERFLDLENGTFKSELSRARTFGFEEEVARLREGGFAKGGSLENAIVIGEDRILNKEGLRYTDEFVRHKIIDCIGDLYLAGAPIIGQFNGICSGHGMNHRLLKAVFSDATAWRRRDLADYAPVPPVSPWPHKEQAAIA
jgi:UDP-3-O-[3-hydroxymyristoyl] N-acetylglucosamine deacetylase